MNEASASGVLLRAVKLLIGTLEGDSRQILALDEAFHYVAESQNTRLSVRERCAAQHSAAAILDSITLNSPTGAQSQVLALIRIALTAAMFELSGGRNPMQPHEGDADQGPSAGTEAEAEGRDIFPLGTLHQPPEADRQQGSR